MASLRACLVGFMPNLRGCLGLCLWAVLWAYYMSHLALRIKNVIA